MTLMDNVKVDAVLDIRYYKCPTTVLKIKKKIMKLQSGQVLKIFCKDPWLRDDLKELMGKWSCKYRGHKAGEKCIIFIIEKN